MGNNLKRIVIATIMVVAMGITSKAMAGTATVSSCTPNFGTLTQGSGQTTVEIAGTLFTGTTGVAGVKFGTVNATSYKVISATLISAVVPTGLAKGSVTISVDNGTGLAASAAPLFTYTTNASNRVLQVSVQMTIAANANLVWTNGTSADDGSGTVITAAGTERITPFVWSVKDPVSGLNQLEVGDTIASNSANNSKALVIRNASATGNKCRIDGICSATVQASGTNNYTPNATPAQDKFELDAVFNVSGGAGNGVPSASQALTQTVTGTQLVEALVPGTLATGPYATVVLTLKTPTSVSGGAGVVQTATVSLVSTAE